MARRKSFSGSNPGMGSFDARTDDSGDSWSLFVTFPKGEKYRRHDLSWEDVCDDLRGMGFIN